MTKLTVELSGPFFQRDPKRTVRANIRRMLEGLAAEGERLVQSAFAGSIVSGKSQRGVRGRVQSLSGKPWALTAVVSQTDVKPWPGGGSKQYRGGKLEAQRHMFRRTAAAMRRSRAVLSANLTEGLN
jgi:hypothetical protein